MIKKNYTTKKGNKVVIPVLENENDFTIGIYKRIIKLQDANDNPQKAGIIFMELLDEVSTTFLTEKEQADWDRCGVDELEEITKVVFSQLSEENDDDTLLKK